MKTTNVLLGIIAATLALPQLPALRKVIHGCPEPMIIPEAGHFTQEHGEPIARAALAHFGEA